MIHKNGPNKQHKRTHTQKNNAKRDTEPGLVAFYNIRPGNGAGLFLQPQSPHGGKDFACVLGISNMNTWSVPSQHSQPDWPFYKNPDSSTV